MAREAGDIAYASGQKPIYVARNQADLDSWKFRDEVILESEVDRCRDMFFTIGIGENTIRQTIARRYAGKLRFTNLIHPSATFGQWQRQEIEAKQGIIISAGVRFTNNIQVGDFSIFNQNTTIAHDVIIEEFVNVAPGACISGNVHLGARCWIGTGAVVNQGTNDTKLNIGTDTMIGSGAVVVKDCEPNAVYIGIPARKIK